VGAAANQIIALRKHKTLWTSWRIRNDR